MSLSTNVNTDNTSTNGNRITLVISSDLRKPVNLPNMKKWKVHERDSVIHGIYSCRLKAKGFFLEHISSIAFRYITVTSKGILMIYELEEKGYVLNLRQAKSIRTETSVRLKDKLPQRVCEMKIKFAFGTVSLFLINNEIPKWRIVVGDFHDGQICNTCISTKVVKDNKRSCKEIQTDESSLSMSHVATSEASIQVTEEEKPDVSVMLDSCGSSENTESPILSTSLLKPPSQFSSVKTSENSESSLPTPTPLRLEEDNREPNTSLFDSNEFVAPRPPLPNPNNRFGALPGFTIRQRCRNTRIFGMTPSHVTSSSKDASQKEPSVRCGSQSVASIRKSLEDKVSKRFQQIQQENEVLHHEKCPAAYFLNEVIPELPSTPPPQKDSPNNYKIRKDTKC